MWHDWAKTAGAPKAKKCWSCEEDAIDANVQAGRQWCTSCDTKAKSLLQEISKNECVDWEDDYVDEWYDKLRASLKKIGDKRDKTTDQEKAKRIASEQGLSSERCTLCDVAFGTDKKVGESSSDTYAAGTPLFHANCRQRLLRWWKHDPVCKKAVKDQAMKSRKQWQCIVAKATACRQHVDSLPAEKSSAGSDDSLSSNGKNKLAETLEQLSALNEFKGNKALPGLAGLAKLLRGPKGATATPADRRRAGLDTSDWDLLDLGVEEAERKPIEFRETQVKNAKEKRSRYLW